MIAGDRRGASRSLTEGVKLSGDPKGSGTVIGWHSGEACVGQVPKGQRAKAYNLSGKRTEYKLF